MAILLGTLRFFIENSRDFSLCAPLRTTGQGPALRIDESESGIARLQEVIYKLARSKHSCATHLNSNVQAHMKRFDRNEYRTALFKGKRRDQWWCHCSAQCPAATTTFERRFQGHAPVSTWLIHRISKP